ncbi:hypothetical protein GCM10009504_33500 [Pseudomonas laurentiana]|uniref:FlxA-like family protein n=1 Tax=Pseudomonas laurentiana TaxID=2364649 RepID=A0A6I5RN58_9PSED|nr:hypothetical protein [Pseudomonas laurentiana]NES09028.1 hypothetical protein [Pseudomonas laurentiana]GGU73543.1 hypothetical protein GCM10009504_33500 [Pseudomonas laurentiana]
MVGINTLAAGININGSPSATHVSGVSINGAAPAEVTDASGVKADLSQVRENGEAKASGASGGDSEPAHIKQLREQIEKLQKQLAEQQKQLQKAMASQQEATAKAAEVMAAQSAVSSTMAAIQTATSALLEALTSSGGSSSGSLVSTSA